MADKEMFDYLSTVTPDYSAITLTVDPQEVVREEGQLNQVIHLGADGSEEVVTYSTKKIFYVNLLWPRKSSSSIGTILDFYYDAAKGNGLARSFKWDHPTDGHTYVVKFRDKMNRGIDYFQHGIGNVRFKVIGNSS